MSKKWAIDFSSPLIFLAPMEGIVDAVNRELITALGSVDVCVTEFVRVTQTLLPERVFMNSCPELAHGSQTPSGVPVLLQLLGSDPLVMAENAARAAEMGALGIDLNFGCPAKTVNSHDGGASLLKIPSRVHDVVAAVRQAVPAHVPVSAKVRLGFDHKDASIDIATAADAAGASWLTVHARTKTDGYRPPAYWEYLGPMREAIGIPLIANGEVWSVEDYHRCRAISGCEHVMIGRAQTSDPTLGRQIKYGETRPPWSVWHDYFLRFLKKSRDFRHENYAVQRTKQLTKLMGQSYGEAVVLMEKIKTLQKYEDMEAALLCREHFKSAIALAPAARLVPNKLNGTVKVAPALAL